jgi:hypothetical protein
MLEGLNRVAWGSLRHAYGSAEDVPHLIHALASPSPDERRAAFEKLYTNLWHQGTIYEATPHAVPFLIELAASNATPSRYEILSYLGTLAGGSSFLDVHRHSNFVNFSQQQLEVELNWVAQTRKAVKGGEAVYLASLSDREHLICGAAGYVLSRFPEEGERYWAPLRARYEAAESNELIRCGIAILTKEFSAKGTSDTQWLRGMFEREARLAVRVALAVSIALSNEAQGRDDALQFLTTNLFTPKQVEQGYHAQPWDCGEAVWDIIRALCTSRRGRQMLVIRFNDMLFFQRAPPDRLDYVRYVLSGEANAYAIKGLGGPLRLLTIPDEWEELETSPPSGQLSLDL